MNILLHPGTHTIRKTVAFKPEDSGTAEAPLNILAWHDPAAPDARPLLVGGAVVTGWKKSAFNGRSDVWEADLKPLALRAPFRQVYLNGKRLTWARYPNEDPAHPYSGGWAYVDGVRPPMYQDIEGERTDTVVLRAKDAHAWSRPQDGEVCIFPRYNWWNRIEKIAAYDPPPRTLTLATKMKYAARPEDRFCVMGLREELDHDIEYHEKGGMILIETPMEMLPDGILPPGVLPTPIPADNIALFDPCAQNPLFEDMPSIQMDVQHRSVYSLYSHLKDKPAFQVGDMVTCGQTVGTVGITGNSVAEHLHLEIRIGPSAALFDTFAMYQPDVTAEERYNYCIWSTSGRFQAIDPARLWEDQS